MHMGVLLLPMAFLVLLFFTLVLKKNLLVSAIAGLLSVVIAIALIGNLQFNIFLGAVIHGLIVALEIGVLIFGALLFYNYLRAGGFIQKLETALQQFSGNKLLIVILMTFFLGSFIEGVSGFGTPAMIFAPLLLGLGFPAYLAAGLPLLSNTVPVIFGAVGTPIKIGFEDLPVQQIPVYAALLMLLPALFIPLADKRILAAGSLLPRDAYQREISIITLMAGFSFAVPFLFTAYLGPDFPSIVAPITGLALWLLFIKTRRLPFLAVTRSSFFTLYTAFKPYLFIAILLVAGKFLIGDIRFQIHSPAIGLKKTVGLFQPGLIFLVGILLLKAAERKKETTNSLRTVIVETYGRLPVTLATIACLAILAKLLTWNAGIGELLRYANLPAPIFYILATITGFLGSFIAGSATVSNLMFGAEWYAAGEQFQLNTPLLLSAQLSGAAIGNALSLQNIVMVQAVINEKEIGASIIKTIWKPVVLMFLFIAMAAVVLSLLTG